MDRSRHDRERAGLRLAFLLNLCFTLLELFGGLWTNSVAIISDAVHDLRDSLSLGLDPMREEAVRALLTKGGGDWAVVEKLVAAGLLAETEYEGRRF